MATNIIGLSDASEEVLYKLSDSLTQIQIGALKEVMKGAGAQITALSGRSADITGPNVKYYADMAHAAQHLQHMVDVVSGRIRGNYTMSSEDVVWPERIKELLEYKTKHPSLSPDTEGSSDHPIESILGKGKPVHIELDRIARELENTRRR